jgi:transcriptional regulator with XRE-family HTH domain
MSRIGSKLKNIRTSRGITQKQLAKAAGVTEKFIDEVESGKRVAGDDLTKRICRYLGEEFSELMVYDISEPEEKSISAKKPVKVEVKEVQPIWSDALESVVKAIPVYNYDLDRAIGTRSLPVISNKVEGYPKDKVFYLNIQDNDMIGFRIMKGDLAFAYAGHEVLNNSIYLIEYGGKRAVRQVKLLDREKALLVCNNGTLVTETVAMKDLKVLAKLATLEIKL